MGDTCVHFERTTIQNEIGEEEVTWVQADTYRCGYSPSKTVEDRDTGERQIRAAAVRLPLSAEGAVGSEDALAITHRFGEALSDPLHLEVDGIPQPGPSALVAQLRSVEL